MKKLVGPVMALAVIGSAGAALIHGFEGRRNAAYQDIVGVWTICDGHTGPEVRKGLRYTDAKCDALFLEDVNKALTPLRHCVTYPVNQMERDAVLSLAFNVGADRVCKSTLVRKLNAGDKQGAANEFVRWNRAGGKPVPGLTRRRLCERDLFLGHPTRNPSCPSTGSLRGYTGTQLKGAK